MPLLVLLSLHPRFCPVLSLQPLLADEVSRKAEEENIGAQGTLVVNEASGIWHTFLRGPPAFEFADWVTTCGWKFGVGSRSRLAPESERPSDFRSLCQKCLPAARQCLEQRLRRQIADIP